MRRFNNSIEITRRTLEKKEALILRLNKKPLSEADVNHYARVFGFDTDEYTKEEKYLLAVNRYCYWHYATRGAKAGMLPQKPN